jgi:hypothetical protein
MRLFSDWITKKCGFNSQQGQDIFLLSTVCRMAGAYAASFPVAKVKLSPYMPWRPIGL